ncbi:hypothetical protein HHI36_006413 [Cryptolaemus montrouzieri]|uniref:Uncharacterized protein n=1 Tax=Cryptolaemus montrouzieri TaxID=559131 RepID=A0ABD2NYF8_9CUCU
MTESEITENKRKIEISSSPLITYSDENSNILLETEIARLRSTDFFLEEPEGCDWDDSNVALKNDQLPESAQETGTFLSLDLQQSVDIELIGINESDLQLSNSSPNSSFLEHITKDFLASNSGNGINPSEHPNNEETNISSKGSGEDNDDEDSNYELSAEEHFNDEASEESAPILLGDDLVNHSKEVQVKKAKKDRKVREKWMDSRKKNEDIGRRRIC